MSWNNVVPAWAVGNPFGPLPHDGKYYYMDRKGNRVGPFDTKEGADTAFAFYNCEKGMPE